MAVEVLETNVSGWGVAPSHQMTSDIAGYEVATRPAPVATLSYYEGIVAGQYNIADYSISRSGEAVEALVELSREGIVMGYAEVGGREYLTAESMVPARIHQLVFASIDPALAVTVVLQTGRGAVKTVVPAAKEA